jgi:hypothetical protein
MFLRVHDSVFQREVLEKLGQLEAKVDMLIGNGQPGRMQNVETRVTVLERNDIRRSVYDRLVNATITIANSAAIALRSVWVEITPPRVIRADKFHTSITSFNFTSSKESNHEYIFRETVQAIAFVPSVVQGIEGLLAAAPGRRKGIGDLFHFGCIAKPKRSPHARS